MGSFSEEQLPQLLRLRHKPLPGAAVSYSRPRDGRTPVDNPPRRGSYPRQLARGRHGNLVAVRTENCGLRHGKLVAQTYSNNTFNLLTCSFSPVFCE